MHSRCTWTVYYFTSRQQIEEATCNIHSTSELYVRCSCIIFRLRLWLGILQCILQSRPRRFTIGWWMEIRFKVNRTPAILVSYLAESQHSWLESIEFKWFTSTTHRDTQLCWHSHINREKIAMRSAFPRRHVTPNTQNTTRPLDHSAERGHLLHKHTHTHSHSTQMLLLLSDDVPMHKCVYTFVHMCGLIGNTRRATAANTNSSKEWRVVMVVVVLLVC